MSKFIAIGLTGGIAAGKSTVSSMLQAWGARVLDADDISRHTLDKGAFCYCQVIAAFGEAICDSQGDIDRKALAALAFGDEQKRSILNSIIHPYVQRQMEQKSIEAWQKDTHRMILWDVPLLFESGMEKELAASIVVTASLEERIERMYLRNGFTKKEAMARILSQMPEEQRKAKADYILYNDGSLQELTEQVRKVYETILQRFY